MLTTKKTGFTLLELLVVMTIISIMTAASLPSFLKFTKTARLRAGARDICTALRSARRYAISKRIAYAVTIYLNDCATKSMKNAVSFYETADSVELKYLPTTVRATYPAGSGIEQLEFTFGVRGHISKVEKDGTSIVGSVTVRVANEDNQIDITTQNATGRIKIGPIE